VRDNALQNSYLKQVKLLTAGLQRATEDDDIAKISQYEVLIEKLLSDLAGKKIHPTLGLALSKLRAQHEQTSVSITEKLDHVKNELLNLKKGKKRMGAYSQSSMTNIIVKA
jgi:hypothetical protein